MATIFVTNTLDNGAGSLRAAIASAQPGDTIAFNPSLANQTITLTSGQIEIPPGRNLIIDGSAAPNLTISGNNASRIFFLNANVSVSTNLTIRNLTLSNAYTNQRGGAILTADQAQLTLDTVTFRNNVADRGGGAVFANWNTNLIVSNSRFENNVATAGNDERGAGAIGFLSPGILRVTNSDFVGNRGINGAAINSLNGKLTIENSRFINNDTTAAFYHTGNPNPSLRGYGGAVYTDRASSTSETSGTIRISGSVFEGNRGRGEGGAAYLFTAAGQDNVILENSLFRNNQVIALPNGGNSGNGGAVVQISDAPNRGFTVTNTTFANNSATAQGGALWVMNAPTTITNSTISGNRAGNTTTPNSPSDNFSNVGGGIAIYSPATITNTTFANNQAEWVGGGLSVGNNAAVTLRNTIFASNQSFNRFQILQHVNEAPNLLDGGGNLQFPARLTNFFNDRDLFPTVTIADPRLSSLQLVNGAWVHTLLSGSPAIDRGVATGTPVTDQTGALRPQDGDFNGSAIVDIGAVESAGVRLPEIAIRDGAIDIADGSTTPINFGTVLVGGTLARNFTLLNSGTATLNLTGLALPTGFRLVGALPGTLAAGASTSVVIAANTATAGNFAGDFNLSNNDSDENPFNFRIQATVRAANNAPTMTAPIPDQAATATTPFRYSVGAGVFRDADNDPLTLTARLTGGNPLPSWLTFDAATRSFSGTPAAGNVGRLSIDLTASDGLGGTVTDTFLLTINPAPITPINGTNLSETLTGTPNRDRIFGFGGQDLISGGGGDDELWGGAGQDRLWGQDGNDTLYGEAGNDQLFGDAGNDALYGDGGDDLINGGMGNDTLSGGAGHDVLTGDAGRDIFALALGQGVDTIRDFRLGEDRIGLTAGLSFGQLTITQRSSQTWITDRASSQLLARLEGVNAAALIAQSGTAFVTL
jgi:predicted outer membrane repeat protein